MIQKVVVTGGNGFIGSHIVREFINNEVNVSCLVRKESPLDNIAGLNIQLVYGDITDKDSLKDAFKGVELVIHNAALSTDWAPYKKFYQTNVEGTANVLNSCAETGIKHVIMTGTISSYGEENSSEIKDETSPFNSHYKYFLDKIIPSKINFYRDTKAEATRIAMDIADENDINLTILEPAFVYGEREFNTGFYTYVKSAAEGMFAAPGSRKNHFPVIYAGDLACAYRLAAEKQLPGIERIVVANSTSELMADIFGLFCRNAGVRKPLLCPKIIFYLPALIMEIIFTILNLKNPPLLTRGRVNMFVDNLEFSTTKAERLLGFKSSTALDKGIKRTVEWYKEKGYL